VIEAPERADTRGVMVMHMSYVEPPDVPEGMTLEAYRRARPRPAPRRRVRLAGRRRRRLAASTADHGRRV